MLSKFFLFLSIPFFSHVFVSCSSEKMTLFSRDRLRNIGTPHIPETITLPPDEWFEQPLDHFSPSDTRLWKQRYFKNEEHYGNNTDSPIFLMIGGEGEASPKWMLAGQWIEYAKQFGALCFQLEHRFYGKSHPTEDMSIKNLVYLNSEQALADLANFIISMNEKYNFDSSKKWILFGGSYPGSLAAWMRLKYPHLVHGAVSSSGPLLAKVDFMEYYSVVVDALGTSSDSCVSEVKNGFKQLTTLLDHMIGQISVDKKFRLCDKIETATKLDRSSFYESLASNFAGIVQYNKDNRIGESSKMSNITIDLVCRLMTDKAAGSAVDRLANVNTVLLDVNNQTCLDYKYQNIIDTYRNVNWNSSASEGGRQWMYQTCNEFGFYQTSSAESDIFSNEFPLEFFLQQCSDIFGPKFSSQYLDNAVRRTNMIYGDLNIQANKIVYVHGSIDPWHALGIIKTKEEGAPAIYITGTAHCANMYPSSDRDLPHLKAARVMVSQLIESWLEK